MTSAERLAVQPSSFSPTNGHTKGYKLQTREIKLAISGYEHGVARTLLLALNPSET
jgi:hypothetical protein